MLGLGVAPQLASAEANSDFGNGTLRADARLNLRVVIPGFLLFRVGSAGATVDTITFDMTSCVTGGTCEVGDSTAFTSGTGGDSGGSGASVALFSNAGAITITESNDTGNGKGLVDGGNSISLDEISAASSNSSLETPTLSDDGGNTSTPALTGGSNVTVQNAVWTYSYDNTTVPDPGTYNVEITYTAASL
jgi:hypothetical protein